MNRFQSFIEVATPRLLNEWDYEENSKIGLDPNTTSAKSQEKAFWICSECGHKFTAAIYDRVIKNTGCKQCYHNSRKGKPRLLKNSKLMKEVASWLVEEWDYEKNKNLYITPETATSKNRCPNVYWICKECRNSWHATIGDRVGSKKKPGSGCPRCAGNHRQINPGTNDLDTRSPEMAKQWHPTKNKNKRPSEISYMTKTPYWWKCPVCGHEWEQSPFDRFRKDGSVKMCPQCYQESITVHTGIDDIATMFPHIVKEWDFDKNQNLDPSQLKYNDTTTQIHWKCNFNHEWTATAYTRTQEKAGCPECRKSFKSSFPEKAVFYYVAQIFCDALENYRIGRNMELDIYIPSIKVGIEYDGSAFHKDRKKSTDLKKNKWCNENNISLYRIREKGCALLDDNISKIIEINPDPSNDNLSEAIKELLCKNLCIKYCKKNPVINVAEDEIKIKSLIKKYIAKNSITEKKPWLLALWDYDLNSQIGRFPEGLSCNSNDKVYFKCDKGHSWYASPNSMGNKPRKCKYCSNKAVLKGFNDLETKFPEIAKQWDFELNKGTKYETPDTVVPGSSAKVWWKCSNNPSHEPRYATVYDVVNGKSHCKECNKEKPRANARKVKMYDLKGSYIRTFSTLKKAAFFAGVSYSSISMACSGKRKSSGGYMWKYDNS